MSLSKGPRPCFQYGSRFAVELLLRRHFPLLDRQADLTAQRIGLWQQFWGGITPPVGVLLFVASGIWRIKMTEIIREIWPFIFLQYGVLLVCMLFPQIVLFLPKLIGY